MIAQYEKEMDVDLLKKLWARDEKSLLSR